MKKERSAAKGELEVGYAGMTEDQTREAEAREWVDALLVDVADEPTDDQTGPRGVPQEQG